MQAVPDLSPSEIAALLILQGGLAVPCIRTELMDMAATAVVQCAATITSREFKFCDLYGDRTGRVHISRLGGRYTSILDIERRSGKPGPIILKFMRLDIPTKVRSVRSADEPYYLD